MGCDGAARQPLPHEASVRGVFAVGDVRSGSVKRVGGAIGDGAAVAAELHRAMAEAPAATPADVPPEAERRSAAI
jgi:thioredoxin reductase (NADPH)